MRANIGEAERPTLWGGTTRNFWGGSTRYEGRIDPGRIDHGADRPAPWEIKQKQRTALKV